MAIDAPPASSSALTSNQSPSLPTPRSLPHSTPPILSSQSTLGMFTRLREDPPLSKAARATSSGTPRHMQPKPLAAQHIDAAPVAPMLLSHKSRLCSSVSKLRLSAKAVAPAVPSSLHPRLSDVSEVSAVRASPMAVPPPGPSLLALRLSMTKSCGCTSSSRPASRSAPQGPSGEPQERVMEFMPLVPLTATTSPRADTVSVVVRGSKKESAVHTASPRSCPHLMLTTAVRLETAAAMDSTPLESRRLSHISRLRRSTSEHRPLAKALAPAEPRSLRPRLSDVIEVSAVRASPMAVPPAGPSLLPLQHRDSVLVPA
mmetsp:Transcript_5409/g.12016  ORF Transcript_5409/g.12016 Transcript_5409/m.12016 type:complete len:316 (+) Transcript_5409:647-1594(+)